MTDPPLGGRSSILVSYAIFVLTGLTVGVSGVLLLAQMDDYGVDRATIGLTFFPFTAGFVLASMSLGPLIHRFGTRAVLLAGGGCFVLSALYQATRPSFVALVAVQALLGYASGLQESVPNAYLAALPRATARLNRLHAFFGVGALVGPIAATWTLQVTQWPRIWLGLAGVCLAMMVAVGVTFPGRAAEQRAKKSAAPEAGGHGGTGLLLTVLREPAVLLGSALLAVYVGLEVGAGTWGVGYLVDARSTSHLVAGYALSGYWLGLTIGRFVLNGLTARMGLTTAGLMYTSQFGVLVFAALIWLVPVNAVIPAGFVLLGFFLGPIFPTSMAVLPDLMPARLVATAIGVVNAGSIVGGSVLPWLEGAIGQRVGVWTLMPVVCLLGVGQLLVWWRLAARMRPPAATDARTTATLGATAAEAEA
jgi:fucose permease